MAAYEHGTNDSVKLSVHARAKKKALGDLGEVRDSLSSPKIADKGESAGISVSRKSSSPPKSLPKASPGSAYDGVEGPEHEQSEPVEVENLETEDDEKTFTGDRSEPTDSDHGSHDLGKPEDVDAALKKFLVKGKKHIKK